MMTAGKYTKLYENMFHHSNRLVMTKSGLLNLILWNMRASFEC